MIHLRPHARSSATRASARRDNAALRESRWHVLLSILAPLGLVLLAAGVRTWNLLALDPFGDEVTWLHWAVDLFEPDNLATLMTPLEVEGRPPLFYWLLLLMLPVDANAFVGGRLAAVVASSATAAVLYWIGATLWSRGVGVVAGLLWAILPLGVIFARLASSDDALLTLCIALVIWTSIGLARRAAWWSGALCGFSLALAVLCKTTGLLAAVIPVVAVLTLAPRGGFRRLLPAAGCLLLTATIGVSPLIPWTADIASKASRHADIEADDRPTSAEADEVISERFERNLQDSLEYYGAYLGAPVVALAAGGLALGVVRRDRAARFLGLAFLGGIVPTIALTTVLYSRYLMSFSLPVYLLAAMTLYGLNKTLASRLQSRGMSRPLRIGLTAMVPAGLLLVLLWPQVTLTRTWITEPTQASLPSEDDWRYFRHRWNLLGLSEHISYLTQASRRGAVSVVQPRESPSYRFFLPYTALRLYLRGEPGVLFDDVPPLRSSAGADRVYRQLAEARRPTYLAVNDYDPEGLDSAALKRSIHARVRERLPSAAIAVKSVRREDGYAIALYRVDQGATLVARSRPDSRAEP